MIIMFQIQGVELPTCYTANCVQCDAILFEIKIIDEFLRYLPKEGKEPVRFYMLHSGVELSSLVVKKVPYLSEAHPFYMLFLAQITCAKCECEVGIKVLTVSSDTPTYQILGKTLIPVTKVKISNGSQQVTQELLSKFDQGWDSDAISPNFDNTLISDDHLEKMAKRIERNDLMQVRVRLNNENQGSELIKQIISSVDFFNEVLESLDKRVSQAENVCLVLKSKVEKMVPILRKN